MPKSKVVKRCPKGHLIDALSRGCPKCSGGKARLKSGRSVEDATILFESVEEAANATVIVTPSMSRGGSIAPRSAPPPPQRTPPPAPPPPQRAPAPPPPPV